MALVAAVASCDKRPPESPVEAATPRIIDIGAQGDEPYVGEGFYQREGPHTASRMAIAAKNSFRWAGNAFTLNLPVFPNAHNEITLHASFGGGMRLAVGDAWKGRLFGQGEGEYVVAIPRDVVGSQTQIALRGSAMRPRQPGAKDTRTLFALIAGVSIRPVAELPKEPEKENLMATCGDIPPLDRLRGIERRPHDDDAEPFVERLQNERANVVTIGAMFGTGLVFFPSRHATPHPQMNPNWLPDVTKTLREKGFKILCWVVFNVQDLRNIADYVPAKMRPQWQMQYIEWPEKTFTPRVGMCVVSSPYIEWYAQVLHEAAAFDFDGFFFDGFYLGGIPHPSRPGCVCEFCAEAFRKDTGLALPKKVDWSDMTFKRWVRWRNERLLKTARYFQAEMRKVNPKLTCTFNYNLWPFARKDWETAIPAWRIDDFGVSQHGYSGKFEEKWLLMGFKSRIGRDINPAHTDMWRASGMETTVGKGKSDPAWYEHEISTFMLCSLAHGITSWHAPGVSPEITARIHGEVAKRERYFSRDHVSNVAVLYSQNTHDFYGHIPDTENLGAYRDGILGTWMLLTENHVPFEFVFDNQVEEGRLDRYKALLLPNAAALSDKALDRIAAWVRAGGRLIATAETAAYDEWGNKADAGRLDKAVGKERVTRLPGDPGLDFCRKRDRADKLISAIVETPMPFKVSAPTSLVVNLFQSPDKRELWAHFLNVSAFMPNGDSGFRGLGLPPAQVKPNEAGPSAAPRDTASDAELAGSGQKVGGANVPAKDVAFSIPGRKIKSARLVAADKTLQADKDGRVVIPVIDLHDVLEVTLCD